MGEGLRLAEAVARGPTIASTVWVTCAVGLGEVALMWWIDDGTLGGNKELTGNGE